MTLRTPDLKCTHSERKNLAGTQMEFTFNRKKNVIESDHPDVYVKSIGFLPGRKVWVLFVHGKRIGVYTHRDKIEGENFNSDRSDYKIINWILSVGEPVDSVASPYKFQSVDEQNETLTLLKTAFACYVDAIMEPKHGIEARFHRILETQIERGSLLDK